VARRALREASDRNYTAAFAALIPHVAESSGATRAFGQVTAVVTELPIAFYNPVLVTRPDADPRDVSEAVQWIRSRGLPASVQLRDDLHHRFDPAIRDLGLRPEASQA
jgi:hypothetical protein